MSHHSSDQVSESELYLDGARAEHHVKAECSDLGHVLPHDVVPAFWHAWNILELPLGIKSHTQEADIEFLTDCFGLIEVALNFIASLVQVGERCTAQFELPAGLKRDALPIPLAADNFIPFHDWIPSKSRHELVQDCLDFWVPRSLQVIHFEGNLLVLCTYPADIKWDICRGDVSFKF